MASLSSASGKVILCPFLVSLAVIGLAVNASRIKGTFQCTGPPTPVTCNKNDLPEVLDGSFNCSGSTDVFVGDVCNLTCDFGFSNVSTNSTVCESDVTARPRNGKWSEGNFLCQDCSDLLHGRTYRFVLDEMSVSNATKNCESLNSSLVFIESKEEDDFVHQLVSKCAPNKGQWKGWTWIQNKESDSGTCHQSNSLFEVCLQRVTTGRCHFRDLPGNRYDNWDTTEPNAKPNTQHCPKEECVAMKYDSGKWHDQCCNRPFYSVCEQNE